MQADNASFVIMGHRLSKQYGRQAVLQAVDITVKPGEVVTVIGPNGSGKSTLLKILLGLEKADSGEVRRQPGLRIGYMPQKLVIDRVMPMTVGWYLSLSGNAIDDVAEETHITPLLQSRIQDLSGGEMQRVLLARALLNRPGLLVLDEPVQGVDVNGQAELYSLISSIAKTRGCAVLMVSHDLHLVMAATDQVICLNHHICCSGHPHSVQQDPAFRALFGAHAAQALAVYTHHHDHEHDHIHS